MKETTLWRHLQNPGSKGLPLTEGTECVGKATMENKHMIQNYRSLKEMILHMGGQWEQQSRKPIPPEAEITEQKETTK